MYCLAVFFFGLYFYFSGNNPIKTIKDIILTVYFDRNLWIEHHLVLNYEILPEQIIFAVRIHKWWFTLFRDKWTKRIKTLFLNESI